MELLTLRHGDECLQLETTDDTSTTRLHLFVTLDAFGPRLMELDVRDVQDLTRALMEWLQENDHPVPAVWLEGEDEEPDVQVLPEHTRG